MRDKIFAMQHGHEGRPSCWVKAEKGVQELLVGHDAARFFRPPYVGQHGWIGVGLDGDVDWIGSLTACDFTVRTGGDGGLHYDEALGPFGPPISYRIARYVEDVREQ